MRRLRLMRPAIPLLRASSSSWRRSWGPWRSALGVRVQCVGVWGVGGGGWSVCVCGGGCWDIVAAGSFVHAIVTGRPYIPYHTTRYHTTPLSNPCTFHKHTPPHRPTKKQRGASSWCKHRWQTTWHVASSTTSSRAPTGACLRALPAHPRAPIHQNTQNTGARGSPHPKIMNLFILTHTLPFPSPPMDGRIVIVIIYLFRIDY
jgi:hypothetical protein